MNIDADSQRAFAAYMLRMYLTLFGGLFKEIF